MAAPTTATIEPFITNDAVVMGLLAALLAFVFTTSSSDNPRWKGFYRWVPALLLCYFLPSIFSSLKVPFDSAFNMVYQDGELVWRPIISGETSRLYFVASRYLLPACLVLLCLSIDLKELRRLGPKAIIMFLTGTIGIVIGGPLAYFLMSHISPETMAGEGTEAVWRGMTTVAGSWIGGGANQTAMKEIFEVGDGVFSAMITVDIIVANVWMAVILYMAGESEEIDKRLKADNSAIKALQAKMQAFQAQIAKIPTLSDTMKILGIGFGATAIAHFGADFLGPLMESLSKDHSWIERISLTSKFFWLIVLATMLGFALSFTKVRRLEGAGASRIGSAFLYILVATIGMKMDLFAILETPELFLLGAIWISVHAILLIVVAKLIKAPVFYLAVGSQANVGGAASAPVVASAFHPTLAPVGVLLAVFGYFVGTFAAWICGLVLQSMAGA